VRIYCRSFGKEDFVTTCYYQFLEKIRKDYPQSRSSEKNDADNDDPGPVVLSQTQSPIYVPTETHKRSYPGRNNGADAEFKSKIPKFYFDDNDMHSP